MMLDLLLACGASPFEGNEHKLIIGGVGVSLLTAAFFVRLHQNPHGRKGHAFEVVFDPAARTKPMPAEPMSERLQHSGDRNHAPRDDAATGAARSD